MLYGCCCRAMFFSDYQNVKSMRRFLQTSFGVALRTQVPICLDNLRFFSCLDLLPEKWEDWPLESKYACPQEEYEKRPHRRWNCKLLSPSGICSIYARRPYICRDFVPKLAECHHCGNWDGENCGRQP